MDWGQVFRGFVPTAMTLDEQAEKKAQWEKSFGLQQNADTRAQSAETRAQTDWARANNARTAAADIIGKEMGAFNQVAPLRDYLGSDAGINEKAGKIASVYKLYNDGHDFVPTVLDGSAYQLIGPGGKPVGNYTAQQVVDMAGKQLADPNTMLMARQNAMARAYAAMAAHPDIGPEAADKMLSLTNAQIGQNFKGQEVESGRISAEAHKTSAAAAAKTAEIKGQETNWEWGPGGWRDRYLGVLADRYATMGQGGGKNAFGLGGKPIHVTAFDNETGNARQIPVQPVLDKHGGVIAYKMPDGRTVSENDLINGVSIGFGAQSPFLGALRSGNDQLARIRGGKTFDELAAMSDSKYQALEKDTAELSRRHRLWVANSKMSMDNPQAALDEIEAELKKGTSRNKLIEAGYSSDLVNGASTKGSGLTASTKGRVNTTPQNVDTSSLSYNLWGANGPPAVFNQRDDYAVTGKPQFVNGKWVRPIKQD